MKARKQGFGQSTAQVDLLCRLLGYNCLAMLWENYYKAITVESAKGCTHQPFPFVKTSPKADRDF